MQMRLDWHLEFCHLPTLNLRRHDCITPYMLLIVIFYSIVPLVPLITRASLEAVLPFGRIVMELLPLS